MAGPRPKEPGEPEIVRIPTGNDITSMMRIQINNYTGRVEESLKGKTADRVPEKAKALAEALGYWDEEKGITNLKKFSGRINEILQESMKLIGKENCFSELCDGARNGQSMVKPMYLSFEGAEKIDVSNGALRDILAGFGKHLDRAKEEDKNVAVNFKSVRFSEDGKFVEVYVGWVGPTKPVEMNFSAANEFTGIKKKA